MKKSSYDIFLSNLASPLRIKIIEALKEKPLNVSQIYKKLKEEQSQISHALASLRRCNIVEAKQTGKTRVYSLNKKTIIPILNLIDKHAKLNCGGKCNCDNCGYCKR